VAAIAKSADDLIIDNMATALREFSAEQVVEDPDVGFRVERDRLRPPSMRDMPLVVIWLDALDPEERRSSGRLYGQEVARINVDCYARGIDTTDDGLDDQTAMARLMYLKEQVKYGLYRLVNSDFGLPVGSIAAKRWPRFQLFQNDLKLPETEVVAGRWVVEVEYVWSPEDITGAELERIAVDAGRWSAFYNYAQEEV
jgi:hypothetical protein